MRFVLINIFSLLLFTLSAQERCGTKSPDVKSFEPWISSKILAKNIQQQILGVQAPVYEIPVVVHIHEPASGGSHNISDERVFRQIEILNEDFGRTNPDAVNTPDVFVSVAADTEIQFVLAKQDPLGNPTNGIVRLRGSKNIYNTGSDKKLIRSESYWPPQNYLNIHVLDIQNFLGYASFPITDLEGINNSSDDSIWDGVLIDYQYFGENLSASQFPSYGRTTTHEIGHYLGLRHIWGDGGCNVDDFVDDTPLADDDNGGLSSPCTFPSDDPTVCVTDEMFQNYMDYTDDECMNLFTEGQKARMRTVMENAPRRTSLAVSPGLNNPIRFSNDLAISEIVAPGVGACASTIIPSVQLSNKGNNVITSYNLTLSVNGVSVQSINQSTSLDINETELVIFDSEIILSVPTDLVFTITSVNSVTDGNATNDSATLTLEQTVGNSLPFSDDFESDLNFFGNVGAAFPWEVVTAAKEVPENKGLRFNSFQNTTSFGENTWMKTPIFDLSGVNSAELRFSYSYASSSATFWDGLAVKISTDCGITFSDDFLFNAYGSELATSTNTDLAFIPQGPSDWIDTTINITSYTNIDGVQIAFVGQNGGNNNIYLDDVFVIQTNLNAKDVSVLEIDQPLLTCRDAATVNFQIRNVGFEEITQIQYEYNLEGTTFTETASNLSIVSGEFETFNFDIDLFNGANEIDLTVMEVNGSEDDDLTNNTVSFGITKSEDRDSYPVLLDFESPHFWTSTSPTNALWEETTVGANRMLIADAYNATGFGTQSWFISPVLDVGRLDSAGLSFKVSYAERAGFNDQLQVLMSINCGDSYTFELLNARSDTLAVSNATSSWIPSSESDWKEFKLDLKPSIAWINDIRLAFVFTNGGGNNLYLDDINIGIKPESLVENSFQIFPNPAHKKFNIAFSLDQRDDVLVQIMDVSGRIIFTKQYENVLDQVLDFDVLSQDGFYFVKITGERINMTERLYIRR
jgi:hypothetical protein